jgi:hypothetical protein
MKNSVSNTLSMGLENDQQQSESNSFIDEMDVTNCSKRHGRGRGQKYTEIARFESESQFNEWYETNSIQWTP